MKPKSPIKLYLALIFSALCVFTCNARHYGMSIVNKDGKLVHITLVGHEISLSKDKKRIVQPLFYDSDKIIKAYTVDDFKQKQAFTASFMRDAKTSYWHLMNLKKQLSQHTDYEKTYTLGTLPIDHDYIANLTILGWMSAAAKPALNKDQFPTFQRKDIGLTPRASTQMALVNLLCFWEQNGLIKFPKTKSEKAKLKALYKSVNLRSQTNSSKSNWQNTASSLFKMSSKALKGDYAIIPYSQNYQARHKETFLKLLKSLDKSPYCSTCLSISLLDEDLHTVGSQALNVLSVNENEIELLAWGTRFTVSLDQVKVSDRKNKSHEPYTELLVTTPAQLPKWIKDKKLKLAFKDKGDGIYYFQLLKKVKAGMKWEQPVYPKIKNKKHL